jgi:hypothetical protein
MDDRNNKNPQWNKTCSQLKQAFQAWDELSRLAPALSADEKRLQEMKSLLKELKGQLDALSDTSKKD